MELDLERRARDLLDRSSQTQPPYNATRVIDVCFPAVRVMGASLPSTVDELTTWVKGDPVILYRQDMPLDEHGLAVARGLARVVLEDVPSSSSPSIAFDRCREARADAFALALLCPLDDVERRLPDRPIGPDTVVALASLFGVPARALMARVRRLLPNGVSCA